MTHFKLLSSQLLAAVCTIHYNKLAYSVFHFKSNFTRSHSYKKINLHVLDTSTTKTNWYWNLIFHNTDKTSKFSISLVFKINI